MSGITPISNLKRKPGILFYCGVGYVFDEVFCPVIREVQGACRITVLMADSFLNAGTKRKMENLQKDGVIEEFHIIRPYREDNESLRGYHKRISALALSLSGLDVDMIVLGEDCQVGSRYILSQFSDPGIKKVVLQSGVVGHALAPYFNPKNQNRSVEFLRPLRVLRRKANRFLFNFYNWQTRFYYRWYRGEEFRLTGYEHLAFASGFCDHVICYDPLEAEILQTVNPLLKRISLARFPSIEGKETKSAERQKEAGKLLVLFGGNLSVEMPVEKINRWVEVTSEIIKLKEMNEVHLRFHPRLSPVLQWPKKMAVAMEKSGCLVKMIDSKELPLLEILHRYDGIVGSPSGALRVARAFNPSMFIIGLPNLCDGDFGDQEWLLGKGEGIRWVREGETVNMEKLSPPVPPAHTRPSVANILLNLLGGRGSE